MRNPFRACIFGLLLASFLGGTSSPAHATSMKHRTIIDLISLSELILVGRVTAVTDGFEGGVPFTEVTVQVDETIKGRAGGVYTFRQFGLRAPRSTPSGRQYVALSPDGWPKFEAGEEVILFLYKKGNMTGLRTTVGLFQGKFEKRNGQFENAIQNVGLFKDVSVDPGLLTPAEKKLLSMKKGSVPAETLISLVRKTVRNRWIENRELFHVK
jgi:hypothetical protein